MIGKVISRYRIVEKLGAGGMGEVYLAEDHELDRKVALKFLPPSFTEDPDINARFRHEAKATAALNHANIITIHDVGEHEGTVFIAMEYVQGRSLRDVLDKEELSLSKLIDIASQICEGLSEAHHAGIVHRDIKPENILIDTKGRVKIVDFGLAKLQGRTRLTEEGSTLGTLEYMSPEQIHGEDVDHRSDIWSMGAMLYEMITGQRPFKGDYDVALTYSIIHDTPEPLARYKTGVSEGLQHVIDKALDKDKETRYQDIGDLLADLKREKRNASEPVKYGTRLRKTHRAKKKFWFGLGPGVALAIASVALLLLRPHRPELNPDAVYRQLQTPFTEISNPGLSEDGNWVAFGAAGAQGKWDVYLMNVSGGEPRCLTSSDTTLASISAVDISPDGSQIIYDTYEFVSRSSGIHIVSSLGGLSKRIAEKGLSPRWRPDGKRIGYIRVPWLNSESGRSEFWSVEPDGSDNRLEFVDSLGISLPSFSWSPDGESIAWSRSREFPEEYHEIILRELTSGKERQLTFNHTGIRDVLWTSRNEIVFSSDKAAGVADLRIVSIAGGEATAITRGPEEAIGPQLSADGRKLLYIIRAPVGYLWIAKIDGSASRQLTHDDRFYRDPRLSPSGKHLLFIAQDARARWQLYLMNSDGSNRQQLTFEDEEVYTSQWSPDGHWIAYSSSDFSAFEESSKVYLLSAPDPVAPGLLGKGQQIWWVDSNRLVVSNRSSLKSGYQNWMYYLDGRPPEKFYEDSTLVLPSHDKDYLLFMDYREGRGGWWIGHPEAGSAEKILPRRQPVSVAPNGEFLIYYNADLKKVRKMTLPDGKDEAFLGQVSDLRTGTAQVTLDGQEIAYTEQRFKGRLVVIENPLK